MTKDERKKVLMICYFFPPCNHVGGLRSTKFAKYLHNYNWHGKIITAYKTPKELADQFNCSVYPTLSIDLEILAANIKRTIKAVISIFKPPKKAIDSNRTDGINNVVLSPKQRKYDIVKLVRNWFLIPDCQFLWILLALPKALFVSRKTEIIYTSLSPYSAHVLGLILKKLTGKPWIADYRDEWTLNVHWKPSTRLHRALGCYLDRKCVTNADYVINVSEARTELFKKHFLEVEASKFVTIHNGYDELEGFMNIRPPENQIVMTSIGSFYGGRDARPFVKALAELVSVGAIDKSKLKINIIGDSYPELLEEINLQDMADVFKVMSRMPQKEALQIVASSHVALLFGSDMEKVAMTTKVYEYAGLGKTILAMVPEGPVAEFVRKAGGYCAHYADVDKIKKSILNAIEELNSQAISNDPMKNEFIKKFSRKELTYQLTSLFDNLMQ